MDCVFRVAVAPKSASILVAFAGNDPAATLARVVVASGPVALARAFAGVPKDRLDQALFAHFNRHAPTNPSGRYVVAVDEASGDCRIWLEAA